VIRWSLIDIATVPDGGGELRLMRRGTEFSIMAGAIELMNSRLSGSEEALATLACDIAGAAAHMLIGGLGMGFTLRAAQKALGPDAQITVAELVPAVLAWARGPLAVIHGDSLADPRLTIHEGDVRAPIAAASSLYDAILLDVDNGPEGLTRKANDGLYGAEGLAAARVALRPGGVLAIWSSSPSEPFTKALRRAGFVVNEVRVRANGRGGGARHIIWMATKPRSGASKAAAV
jgi:spermidine synthase